MSDIDPDYIDFDDEEEEAQAKPLVVKVAGKKYELPASPSARSMLRVRRVYTQLGNFKVKEATGNLSEEDALRMVEMADQADVANMLGEFITHELVEEWLANDISERKLKSIFQRLWRRYNGIAEPEPGEEGEAPKANRAQRRAAKSSPRKTSSATGRSSKAISKGNTKSTSRARSAK